jgi:prolyl 4-hydroxylase
MITVLVYLSDLPADGGGATVFPERGVAVAPAKGTALVFFPTLRDGRLNPHALHAGQEVTAGTKLVLQVWYAHGDRFSIL